MIMYIMVCCKAFGFVNSQEQAEDCLALSFLISNAMSYMWKLLCVCHDCW